ncbi:hypothetical protein D9611_004584 [Ephemerocybe angulata]|uniref:PAN2-PAN3 deadenylation complex catalytic subunit PAN2 n=1 Tax=Ephemerocybe angulata TaxID=980116 RepID=A0A8H5BKA5_9AGAR|nr:hypothetical protein D9611_004584 [Tulosesus angulatus]
MSNTYHPVPPITPNFPQPSTAIAFDPVSDILWTGSTLGNVTAYYGSRGMRGVSFPVGGALPVNRIFAGDSQVLASGHGSGGIGSWSKGGMNKWYFRTQSGVSSFSNVYHAGHSIAVSLLNLELAFVNSMTGTTVRQVQTSSILTHLQFSHSSLLSGSAEGYIRVHDPRTGVTKNDAAESVIKAHSGAVTGLQSTGNYVFTIGMGERQSRPYPDPLVKVYDLRTMRALPPIPFSSGPAFIHVLPKRTSSIVVASMQGLVNIVDASDPAAAERIPDGFQLDVTTYVTSLAVSPTGAYIAAGDAEGVVHILSQSTDESPLPFNGFDGQPIPWVGPAEPLPEIGWTPSTPLNSIGMPYYDSPLFSAWSPPVSSAPYFPPPARIPPQVSASMKMNDNIAYAPLPKELRGRRNLVPVGPKKDTARFRSGKPRKEDESDRPTLEPTEVPPVYRRVEIEYSKFGVEDFDFGFYNQTQYSGLETHILNSYTNSLVQSLHYIHPIRQLAKSHITTNCLSEHCLLCELGFVSRMLEDAKGTNCQASNFCRTVGVLAQASNAIELVDYGRENPEVNYAQKIQIFHRFLLDHLISEGNAYPRNPILVKRRGREAQLAASISPITQLIGVDAKNVIVCQHCKAVREKDNLTHVIDLTYPRKGAPDSASSKGFTAILQQSLLRNMTHKATCQKCKHFSTFTSRRSIASKDLPPFLAVNASVYNDENMDFWLDTRNKPFLRPKVQIHGQMGDELDPAGVWYELKSLVVKISTKERQSHLVSLVKIPDAELDDGYDSPWFIFNDFMVQNMAEQDVLSFPGKWKVPSILYLERIDSKDRLDLSSLPSELDPFILCQDTSISQNRDHDAIRHELLHKDELPNPGTLVAIDAEFVSMQQEETEFRSDGTKKVIRPARLSLARVSVLRGDGPRQGVPFIDDHIHTSETIVDYLTEFSGIKCAYNHCLPIGDLDPVHSRYTLTPLKVVYKKLRALVDRGCIFVGHGLSKDFRIINIFVPPEQVIDTVDLYFVKSRQRRLSLRFLSWFILHQHIQTDNHDSIEDARSALSLYYAYQDLESEGMFDQKLDEIYKEGRQYNFKPPPLPGASPPLAPMQSPVLALAAAFNPQTSGYNITDSKPATPSAGGYNSSGNIFGSPGSGASSWRRS